MADYVLGVQSDIESALDWHAIYIRSGWGRPWTQWTTAYMEWAVWSLGGREVNRAQIFRRYGEGLDANDQFVQFTRGDPDLDLKLHVKIEAGDPTKPWFWVGTIETVADILHGGETLPHGELKYNCYGMEYQLEDHRILDSTFMNKSDGDLKTTQRGLTFNWNGRGNRSEDKFGTAGSDSYVFGFDDTTNFKDSEFWSSLNIVEYLLKYQTNPNQGGGRKIPWVLAQSARKFIPDYDAPEVDPHGVSTLELLDSLISRQRGIFWWPEYDNVKDEMVIRAGSFTDVDVDLGDGNKIPKSDHIHNIKIDTDPSAVNAVRTINSLDWCDQVVVQGARRTSTFTINQDRDKTVSANWTDEQRKEYNKGASDWEKYNEDEVKTDKHKRRELNAQARTRDEVSHVFSEITLLPGWDFMAGDGEGGEKQPVIPIDGDNTRSAEIFLKDAYISQSLALLTERDYSGNAISSESFEPHSAKPHEPMKPIALALTPDQRDVGQSNKLWVHAENIGVTADLPYLEDYKDREWSCRVRVLPDTVSLLLEVLGTHQHVIAKGQFEGLPEDNWDKEPEFDWAEWIFTITLVEDRITEFRWPADGNINSTSSVRKMYINAGNTYRRDYVVPNTVVGIDPDSGKLLKSTSGGYVRDDVDKLESVAKAAYVWYGRQRRTFEFETVFREPANDFRLGDYIDKVNQGNSANQQELGSVISEMKLIHHETRENQTPENAKLLVTTGFAELDPQVFLSNNLS